MPPEQQNAGPETFSTQQPLAPASHKYSYLILLIIGITTLVYFSGAYYLTLWPFNTKSETQLAITSDSTATIRKYTPDDLGFLVTVPTDWKSESIELNEPDLVTAFKYESPDGRRSFLISIIGDKDPENMTLAEWSKQDAIKYDNQAKRDEKSFNVGNNLGSIYSGEVNGKFYKIGYLIRGIPKHVYKISVEMDKNNSWMPEFDQILVSFKFSEPRNDSYEIYKNLQFAFELTHPSTWRVREESEGVRLRNHYNPILDLPIEPKDFTISYQKDENPQKLSVENWLAKNTFWTTFSKSKEFIKIDGKDTVKIYYESPSPMYKDKINKSYRYIIFRDADVIHTGYGSMDGLPDPVLDKIILSIKFTPFDSVAYSTTVINEQNKIISEDKNNDGVWDYVGDYINQKYSYSAKIRSALIQYVKVLQQELIDSRDKQKSIQNAHKSSRAIDCLNYIIGNGEETRISLEEAHRISSDVEAETLNTKERSEAYIVYNGQLSGESFRLSEYSASDCDFDPSKLPN